MTRFWIVAWMVMATASLAHAATYTINTNAAGEGVLDQAIAPGGSHQGRTKTQVLQSFVNRELITLNEQQIQADAKTREEKIRIATSAAKQNALTALNAGITAPTVEAISNQSHAVNTAVSIPVIASHPYPRALLVIGLGLPPGVEVVFIDNAPFLAGTVTTAGTYPVTIRAYSFPDIVGETAFTWTVTP